MDNQTREKIKDIFKHESNLLSRLEQSDQKWKQLERLHVIGQMVMPLHYRVHYLMLMLAIRERKKVEVIGQILRIILVFPGHLFGKLPIGNIGTTRVSAFKPMAVPADLKDLISKDL